MAKPVSWVCNLIYLTQHTVFYTDITPIYCEFLWSHFHLLILKLLQKWFYSLVCVIKDHAATQLPSAVTNFIFIFVWSCIQPSSCGCHSLCLGAVALASDNLPPCPQYILFRILIPCLLSISHFTVTFMHVSITPNIEWSKGGRDGHIMRHVWVRREIHTGSDEETWRNRPQEDVTWMGG